MKTPVLIELAIQTVLVAFAGKIRSGPGSFPTATHSLRVGLALMAYGYPVDVCLGGFFHDLEEDIKNLKAFILEKFGARAHFLMMACTLDPTLEEEGPGEDELYQRVVNFAEGGDLDPLRIKCTDSLDNLRTNVCLKLEYQKHALFKAKRWHAAALRYLPSEMLASDLGHMVEWESRRMEVK